MVLPVLVLAQRAGAQQRAVRRRHGAVGHHRQTGRHAGVRAARRAGADGSADLLPCQWRQIAAALEHAQEVRRRRLAAPAAAGWAPRPRQLRGSSGRGLLPRSPAPGRVGRRRIPAATPELFEAARGSWAEVELVHDVHSRLTPKDAVRLMRKASSRTVCSSSRTWCRRTTTTGCRRSGWRRRRHWPWASSCRRCRPPYGWCATSASTSSGCSVSRSAA